MQKQKTMTNDPYTDYYINNKFIPKLLADDLMTQYTFKTMHDNKDILIYEAGVYRTNGRDRILQIVQTKLKNLAFNSKGVEVAKFIETATLVNRNVFNESKTVINFKNGLYDLESGFKDHTPELLSTIQIPVNYDPDVKCPRIEKFLSEIVSEQDVQVLLEWFGYCLIPNNQFQKAMMLCGDGANGKSTILGLLAAFLGIENVSSSTLQRLETEKFAVAGLFGKLANICADIPSNKMHKTDVFKSLSARCGIT